MVRYDDTNWFFVVAVGVASGGGNGGAAVFRQSTIEAYDWDSTFHIVLFWNCQFLFWYVAFDTFIRKTSKCKYQKQNIVKK